MRYRKFVRPLHPALRTEVTPKPKTWLLFTRHLQLTRLQYHQVINKNEFMTAKFHQFMEKKCMKILSVIQKWLRFLWKEVCHMFLSLCRQLRTQPPRRKGPDLRDPQAKQQVQPGDV